MSLTDNDSIEKSNLSRQLLFDDSSIGQSKSVAAGNKIISKNSDVNVHIYESRVEPSTEHIFNEYFHRNIDVYLNALDNVTARRYMDTMAIRHEKPLIDSGTTGAQASVGIIVPYLTESYNSQKNDASEEQIPLCTLKSLPFRTEHTIQWSRELFEEEFKVIPGLIKKYTENNFENIYKTSCGELSNVCKKLYKYKFFDGLYESVIILAKIMYYENFVKNIKETIETYKNKEGFEGKLPTYLDDKISQSSFIDTTVRIYNQVFKTNFYYGGEDFDINFDNYYGKQIEETIDNYDEVEIQTELSHLLLPFLGKDINEVDFEKDDDSLFHIDWITISSNMRNYQYSIKETDKFQVRIIAGKIIPAMITTTSVVAGYQLIEFVKLVGLYEKRKYEFGDINKDIEKYRNKYVNLNTNYHIGNEPTSCPKYKLIKDDENISSSDDYSCSDDSLESPKKSQNNRTSVNLWTRFVSNSNKTEDIVNLIKNEIGECLTIYSIEELDGEKRYIYDDYETVEEYTSSIYCQVEFDEFEEHNTKLIVYISFNDMIFEDNEEILKKPKIESVKETMYDML
jgi:molybdopterin/thiamine biosynthesis adenylyltransferase